MKKHVLVLALLGAACYGYSQTVIFDVLTPEPVAGLYPVEYAPQGAEGWSSVPDLSNVDNAITGELVYVNDGTAGDTLGCEALVNGADVAGKIAVVWRGVCPFAQKAFHAWEAGAIGVMIINNATGTGPIVPGAAGGGLGESVDVPVAMTDRTTGELLRQHILAGTATAFLGAVPDFANDLVIQPARILRTLGASFPSLIAQNAAEFSVPMGAFVGSAGNATQTGVTLNATVTLNGNVLYNETAGPLSIAAGEEAFFALPTFSQSSYAEGNYVVIYSTTGDQVEDFPVDNQIDATFSITPDVFAYTPINPATGQVLASQWLTPATFVELLEICVHFRSPYASRLRLEGFTFAAWNFDQPLTGEIIDITAYEWNNEFVTLEDLTGQDLNIEPWDFGVHQYDANLIQENIYVPFENNLVLTDNQRYLFCAVTTNPAVRFGHAPGTINLDLANEVSDQPTTTVANGTNFFLGGWAGGQQAAWGVHFSDASSGTSNVQKVDINPYPNPTNDFISIPYAGVAKVANLQIFDIMGKMVKEVRVNFNENQTMQVDMAGVPNGTYVFNLQFNDNTSSNFKVVVAR